MAMLHYQRQGADAVGTLAGTVEAIGAITLPNNATKLYGFIFQDGSTGVTTTAEGVLGIFTVLPNELGKRNLHCHSGTGLGGSPAANIPPTYDPGFFIPFKANPVSPANVTLDFQYDIAEDATNEQFAQVFALTSNGAIDESVLKNRGRGLDAMKTYSSWWDSIHDEDIGLAVAEAMDTNIIVPSWVKLITGIAVSVQSDVVYTAGEHWMGWVEISGTIPNLYPMQVPIPARGASLGAPVAQAVNNNTYVFPLHIPHLANANSTLTFTINLDAVTTGVSIVGITLFGTD